MRRMGCTVAFNTMPEAARRAFPALLLLLLSLPAWAQQQAFEPSLAPMLDEVRPAVVNIATRGSAPVQQNPLLQDPFFRRFFGFPDDMPQQRAVQSLGSGVIVDAKEGYVLTNAHVIEAADEITVTLSDGRELAAEPVGADPETDVAVIKVDAQAEELVALPFGDSQKLRVGDFVVAVGNPFGLGQTATSGIVSALERTGLGIEGYEAFIQTDASINPGNSGGALVNLSGELVGINTAILSQTGGNIGIGFAIPINMARAVADQLIEHGSVDRGQLGVGVQDLNPELAEALGVSREQGVVIAQVVPDSAAADAGLQVGDVVTSLNGRQVTSASALRNRIGLMRAGDTVALTVLRDGRERQLQVELRASEQAGPTAGNAQLEGAELSTVEVNVDGRRQQRVGVVAVQPGSPAAAAGLNEGDLILSVNQRPVSSVAELQAAIEAGEGRTLLHVRRGDSAFFLLLE